ncbi:MAG: Smr/MutS family protein [Deltaproteobacteria bacterium]|nr:Smr/MutS family protein [Deltaproteobacteria bacterium]
MNPTTLDILDYGVALETLAERTHSAPGARLALALKPNLTPPEILNSWARIEEAQKLALAAESPDFRDLVDLSGLLVTLGPEGALIEPLELLIVGRVAATSRAALEYFQPRQKEAPLLFEIAQLLDPFDSLVESIEASVGPEGEILDTASPALARLRQDLISSRLALTAKLTELTRSPEFKPLLMDDIITTRGERFVVPVRAGAASRSRGLTHDWSKSGATAYLEPLETVEDNNHLAYLRHREKEEILRILRALASQCRQAVPRLAQSVAALTQLDLIMAQGRLTNDWRAITPEYLPGEGFQLRGLRHPLLEKRLLDNNRVMIPLDLVATPQSPTLVISGLNAGGKTVALKTLGLTLALARSGLPIPAKPGSSLDFPEDILAIMGDNQDLTADLSTFSSHAKAIGQVLAQARPGVVILLDEIGGGTDPAEGAALGLAVLEKLRQSGAFCLAATHFHLIKSWAALTEGVVSVAVKSSPEGQPIYGLTYGSPGFSGGLAMARRMGLPEELVARAESYLDDGQKEAIALLSRLEEERGALWLERTELAKTRRALALTEEETRDNLKKQTDALKRQSLEQDRQIKAALARHQREMTELKKEIRDLINAGQKPDLIATSLKLANIAQQLSQARPEILGEAPTTAPLAQVAPGDRVLVGRLGRVGIVKAYNPVKNEALVETGSLSVKIALAELFPPKDPESAPLNQVSFSLRDEDTRGLSLNLLGQTVEEATLVIDREIDRALVNGQKRLTIIHGLGSGRLRRGIAHHLKSHPKVVELIWPTNTPGGHGVTTVELS